MKSSTTPSRKIFGSLFAAMLGLLSIGTAHAQIYEANSGELGFGTGSIGKYNTNGGLIAAPFVSYGSGGTPNSVAVSGNNLYVTDWFHDQIDEYSATTGVLENQIYDVAGGYGYLEGIAVSGGNVYALTSNTQAGEISATFSSGTLSVYNATTLTGPSQPLISGLNDAHALVISGNNVYISEEPSTGNGFIGEYNATTGAQESFNISLGVNGDSAGLAISGNSLYVSDDGKGTITQYDATTGAKLSSFSTNTLAGVFQPEGIAISGSDIYVAGASGGNIAEFTTSGQLVSPSIISGLQFPVALAVVSQAGTLPAPTVTPISSTTSVSTGGTFGNVTPVTAQGGLGTTVSLIGGTATSTEPVTLATTNLGSSFKNLASDVVTVSGMANLGTTPAGATKTDMFVLKLTFDLNAANEVGGANGLAILWFNQAANGGQGTWVNAVLGNSDGGSGLTFVLGAYNPGTDDNLSYYGVDVADGYAWAVLNHNSTFGVGNTLDVPEDFSETPEPSTWALLLGGLGLLAFWRARRTQI